MGCIDDTDPKKTAASHAETQNDIITAVFMPSEDILDHSHPPIALAARRSSSKKNLFFWIHGLTFLLGMGLLVTLIYRLGYQSILESVSKMGWGFLAIFALN